MNIFVGNLSYSSTEDTIRVLFEPFGDIDSVKIITDRDTGRSRGFGFVEMASDDEARAAIAALDGKDLDGRPIKVNESRPRPDRRGGGRPPRRDRF
jgi:RNA recognition motif-containing protein